MNAGARHACGDFLLFLHADSELPDGFVQKMDGVVQARRSRPLQWGCFQTIQIDVR